MQAAVNRLSDRKTVRQGENSRASPHLATADDVALLGALPIAAAVIGKEEDGLKVLSFNGRFKRYRRAVDLQRARLGRCRLPQGRSDRGRSCASSSKIGGASGELDFRDGEGVCGPLLPAEARPASARRRRHAAMPPQPRRPHGRGAGRSARCARKCSATVSQDCPIASPSPRRSSSSTRAVTSRRAARGARRRHASLLAHQREHG